MAATFAALRHARLALVLVAFSLPAVARADDAPPPQPAATPSGQKAGGRGDAATPPAAAAERHHDVGIGGIVVAVKLRQLLKRLLGLRARAGKEGNPVISLGRGHVGLALGLRAHVGAEKDRERANVVYTTLAGLVEIGSQAGMSRDRVMRGKAKLAITARSRTMPTWHDFGPEPASSRKSWRLGLMRP